MRFAGLALLLVFVGCASDPMADVRAAYTAGDPATARDLLLELEREDSGNAHLYQLELGVAHQANLDPAAAVQSLRSARDRLDALARGNYTDWASSVLLDDRSTDYPGADYEHVLVRAMLAVADLMNGGHDAFSFGLQVLEKQLEIIRTFDPKDQASPKQGYKLVAFGNYLRAIIAEENPRTRSEARKEYAKVRELAPWYRDGEDHLARATNGSYAKAGHGVVHVLAMVGRAPFRVEVKQRATRDALAIAQLIWSIKNRRPFVPNIVPLPIPALAFHEENPETVAVFVDDELVQDTAVITDVEETARIEFDAMRPWTLARAVIRRVLKAAVVEGGKEVIEHNNKKRRNTVEGDLINVGLDVLGNLWAATEGADLRCWSLLPASFQVLRVELPEGEHDIVLRAGRGGQLTGGEQRVRVRVFAGYNTYVLGLTPTQAGGPPPLTSRSVAAPQDPAR